MRPAGIILSALALAALCGCAMIGPPSITAGRLPYAEAITATGDEQLLQLIVRDRYDQRLVPLSVLGVTANVRFSSRVGFNAGIGPNEGYEGNLVPLSAGFAYEENPTISYAPVDTATYLKQLHSPIPLDLALLLLRSSADRKLTSLMLLERLNGLKNPANADSQGSADEFVRVVEVLTELLRLDLAEFVSIEEGRYGLLVQVEEIERRGRRAQFLEAMSLLELNDLVREIRWSGELPSGRISGEATGGEARGDRDGGGERGGEDDRAEDEGGLAGADAESIARSERRVLVISIRFSAVADGSSLAITTRSLHELVRVAAAAVDVPEDHVARGLTGGSGRGGSTASFLQIRRSEARPADAAVATRLNGSWFYVSNSDRSTKQYLRTLSTLWSARIASVDRDSSPVLLTVPVSQ